MIRDRKEARLVLALAAGANATSAARRAGCSRATVFRRLQDADFCRAVGKARGQILSRATARLARTSTQAVDTLQSFWTTTARRCGGARRRAFWTRSPG